MKEYNFFVNTLQESLINCTTKPKLEWQNDALKLVNGYASDELRRLIPIDKRKAYGAFFTDSLLAEKIIDDSEIVYPENATFYDPACGAGNLLLAACNTIKKRRLTKSFYRGTDLHESFIAASILRLEINNLLNDSHNSNKDYELRTSDGLKKNEFYKQATHIITNPPFNLTVPIEKPKWSNGKVSAAALFIDKIIEFSNPGVTIIAILPDVLRSGTRYEKWRKMVEYNCDLIKIELLGQFDKYADVDVFCLKAIKKNAPNDTTQSVDFWKTNNVDLKSSLDSLFNISVGTVVDNRDKHEGKKLPYIVSRGLVGWKEYKKFDKFRLHYGKSVDSPFVVIKRTSRLGDKYRTVASLINTNQPVFVDNHLIILKPKSGLLIDCKFILKKLQEVEVSNWINNQIRCRHLTVKVIAKIPL